MNPEDFIQKAASSSTSRRRPSSSSILLTTRWTTPTASISSPRRRTSRTSSKAFKAESAHLRLRVHRLRRTSANSSSELDASTEVRRLRQAAESVLHSDAGGRLQPRLGDRVRARARSSTSISSPRPRALMSSMDLREIEEGKIDCARKFFAKITRIRSSTTS